MMDQNFVNRCKRIAAFTVAILLAGLYITTLVLAIIGTAIALKLLAAAIFLTVLIPVILYGLRLITRLLQDD